MFNEIWLEFCKTTGIKDEIANKWKDLMIQKYSEPQRHYHTLTHIERMLKLFSDWRQTNDLDYQVYILAVVFHDVIYDPKSKTIHSSLYFS